LYSYDNDINGQSGTTHCVCLYSNTSIGNYMDIDSVRTYM